MTATHTGAAEARLPVAIIALAAANFAMGTQGFVFAGVLAELAADLGVTIGRAGFLVTAAGVAIAVAAPAATVLLGGFERRSVMLAGLAVLMLANLASAFAPDYGALFLLRMAAGVAAGAASAMVSASVAPLVAPERRGRAFALVVGGMTVAFVLGIPIGSAIGGAYGWRATFLFGAGVTALAIALITALLPRVAPTPGPAFDRAVLFADARTAPLLALTFLSFMAMFTAVSFVGPLVTHATGATGAGVGAFQTFVGIGSFVGLALGGALSERGLIAAGLMGLLAMIAVTLLGYGATLAAPAGATPPYVLAPLILAGAAALFGVMPIILARLSIAAGAMAPLALSLNASLASLGQGAGALWGGLVTDVVGFAWVGPAGAVVALVGVGVAATRIAGRR